MPVIRRLLQAVALVGTLIVGVVALALIVSQTPWFRDWLRGYIVQQANHYLEGELTIGGLEGNLFFDVRLTDVAVDLEGERVITVRTVAVDHSIVDIISEGAVVDEIRLVEPLVRLERGAEGWNLGRLVTAREVEADREGPDRPLALHSIQITSGTVIIEDEVGTDGYRLPDRIDELEVRASFGYEPVHYTVGLEHISLRTTSPQLSLDELSGIVAVRDDNIYLDQLAIRLTETALTVDGVIEQYTRTPVLRLRTAGQASLPEVARIVPALAEYELRPAFDVRASGPIEALDLTLDVRSEAGIIQGDVKADLGGPDYGVAGDLDLERLDLAPIVRDPDQRSDITGQATVDLRIAGRPEAAPVLQRMSGTFAFTGPRVAAAGYEASNVAASGAIAGRRVELDARAAAYGGTATARGFIDIPIEARPLGLELRGRADGLDLRNLRPIKGVPALETNLSVAEYHVRGIGSAISGSAMLNRSVVEGAMLAPGMMAEFRTDADGISYAARGHISDLNLARLGRALEVEALARPEYESRITGDFDVTGSGTELEEMRIDASGTLTDSELMGTRFPELAFKALLEDAALAATVQGGFENLDPARIADRPQLEGQVTGTVDASFRIDDLTEPITPDSIAADGRVALAPSRIGEIEIASAVVQGHYSDRTGEIAQLEVTGPDVTLDASGRIALDRTASSAIDYHIDVANIEEVGRLAGQSGLTGSAILEGTITGNEALLRIEGTLDGSNLGYEENTVLDLTTTYSVAVPELSFADARVEATSQANFLTVGGVDITQLVAETTYADTRLDFAMTLAQEDRELEAGGRVVFHPDHQELHLPQLAMRAADQTWMLAPDTEAAVQYGEGRITIEELRLVSADQSLEVDGTLVLNGEEPGGELRVNAANVDLAQLERLLLQDRGLSGRLHADATISGTRDEPEVDGRVEIVNGGFREYRYESLVAEVQYLQDRIELDAKLQQSPAEAITATGSVPTTLFAEAKPEHVVPTEEDRIDLRIQSTELGLGFVQGFTTAITGVTGTLQADVLVTGSGHDPHFEGFVDIRGGAFDVPLTGVSYTGLDTRIDLLPDIVRIQEFAILDEHGAPLSIAGRLAVHARQVGEVDISLVSRDFEILDNELGDVGIDSNLLITGELFRPRIVGEVRVARGRLEVDRILELVAGPYAVEALPAVISADRTVEDIGSAREATRDAMARARTLGVEPVPGLPEEAPEPAEGALSPLALDVRVVMPDNLVVRGRDLRPGGPTAMAVGDVNITVGGDVRILKEPGEQIRMVGTITTVRGTYEFQGRRFALERGGTIRFTGDPAIEPLLDIVATRLVPNTGVEVRLRIAGTPQAPELELSSTPPLEESDILSLIVFNRPVNELGTGERASLAATAGGIATGFIAAPLGESIGRALDLDLFEITTTTEAGELGAGITIGQQIGDRMFIRLRQQFGERTVSEFMLEYQIARFMRLQTSLAPESVGTGNRLGQRRVERAGVDLFFFFSY